MSDKPIKLMENDELLDEFAGLVGREQSERDERRRDELRAEICLRMSAYDEWDPFGDD